MLGDIEKRLRELESLLFNLVRVGEVTAVFPDRGTARVRFQDKQGLVTAELRVPARTAHKVKDYAMPDVGEPVLCVFLPRGREAGFILCSFYTKTHTPPVESGDKRHVAFDDGTWLEYDRAAHRLTGHVQGNVELTVSGGVSVDAGEDILAQAGGNIHAVAEGDIQAGAGGAVNVAAGSTVTVSAPAGMVVNTPLLTVNGALTVTELVLALGFGAAGAPAPSAGVVSGQVVQDAKGDMAALRSTFNPHKHTDSLGGSTGAPDRQM